MFLSAFPSSVLAAAHLWHLLMDSDVRSYEGKLSYCICSSLFVIVTNLSSKAWYGCLEIQVSAIFAIYVILASSFGER